MDNEQFQPMQSMPPVQPMQSNEQMQPNMGISSAGQSAPELELKDNSGVVKTVVIVIVSLFAATFLILFVWMTIQYNEVNSITQGEIDAAVASAVNEAIYKTQEEDLAKFNEEEKYPYRSFAGPADYGQLSFEYPKTWSVYIASDASKGGDYQAYLNPLEVNPVSNNTVNSLRVTIRDKAYDDVAAEYQRYVERNDSNLSAEATEVFGTTAIKYVGQIPNTELYGVVVIFKIRDKTAILQTDAMPFLDDFNNVLGTVKFNA